MGKFDLKKTSSDKPKIKLDKGSIAILIVLALVIVAVVGYKIFSSIDFSSKSSNDVEVSDTLDTNTSDLTEAISDETTQLVTESTTQSTTAQASVGKISNIQSKSYDIWSEDAGGFMGVIMSFDPVSNADGYRVKYVFDNFDGTESSAVEDIDSSNSKFWFGTQSGPMRIEMCPYLYTDAGDVIYGEWATIYGSDVTASEDDVYSYSQWNNMTNGYYELNPEDYC